MVTKVNLDQAWTKYELYHKELEEIQLRLGEDPDDRALAEVDALEIKIDEITGSDCESKRLWLSLIHEAPENRDEWRLVEGKCDHAIKKFVDPGDRDDRWRIYVFADHSLIVTGGGSVSNHFHFQKLLERCPDAEGDGSLGQLAAFARSLTPGGMEEMN